VRLLFAGTPVVAVPALRALLDSHHEVVAVLTRPDARSGRGRRLAPSPVAEVADDAGVLTLKPNRVTDPGVAEQLSDLHLDCAPIVAYGGLVPTPLLELPAHGWVNLHFSLLPAWRGAAPVQRAVLAGDTVTGATTFRLDRGLDTGPVFGVTTETIRATDTSGDLLERLSHSGAQLLVRTLDGIERGELVAVAQSDEGVSLAPKLRVADARIDWSAPGLHVDRLVRACTPAPGAWTMVRGERLKVLAVASGSQALDLAPGRVDVDKHRVSVGTGSHAVDLVSVQPQGKAPMAAADWARGLRLARGESLE
jgi:methionyl-tRNA formyltransferase